MNTELMFSSEDMTWETPQHIFDRLNEEFGFTLDVCATKETAKCKDYFSPEDNAFTKEWVGVCWMNPPYGKEISKWIEKAYDAGLKGETVVCLIPSRTDTKYWHNYCMRSAEIRFIKGRLKFGDAKNSAPFPSAIVIFNKNSGSPKMIGCDN